MASAMSTAIFPDQQQTEEFLATLSPRTVRKFWKFVATEPLRRRELSPLSPFDDLKSDSPGVLTARIFKASQKWRMFTLSPNTFIGRARNLAGPGTMDIFEQLPSLTQEKIWTDKFLGGEPIHCAERAYLELVHRTKLSVNFYRSYYDPDRNTKIVKVKEPLSQPSKEFLELVNRAFPRISLFIHSESKNHLRSLEFGSYSTESMMMLRYLYGEENVIEMCNRFIEAGVSICSSEAITILDSWEEWKHYSVDWIAASNGFKH